MAIYGHTVSWPGWTIVKAIGRGSYGTVYEIQRNILGDVEKAALKHITIPADAEEVEELRCEGYDDANITALFRSYLHGIVEEYKVMARMRGHKNIVQCDDVRFIQQDDGIGWNISIKMELLTPILKLPPDHFTQEEVIQLGIDICRGLEACKKEHILHRDIKPQNLFISKDGDYKLGDFGIAKTVERTASGTKIGTYKYMAPEVYNNKPYGAAADLYSLGMVLYWLLNHRRAPFLPLPPAIPTAADEDAARMQRCSGRPLEAPAFGSIALKKVILKACAFSPEQRYADPAQMRHDLEQLLKDTVTLPPPAASVTKRRRRPYLAALAMLGVICIGSAVFLASRKPVQAPAIASTTGSAEASSQEEISEPKFRTVLSAGANYTLRLRQDGSVISEGQNNAGQGNVSAWQKVLDIDAGWNHSVGLLEDGTVVACGANDYGQCHVTGWTQVIDVDVGWRHTVAVQSDGTVLAAGDNQYGQCDVSSWTDIIAVSAGFTHTVGLKSDGTLVSVGENSDGECDVSGIGNVAAISAGVDHTVALHHDGTVTAVGANDYDECNVSHWQDIIAISAASTYTIGLQSDGTVVVAGSRLPEHFDTTAWHNVAAISAGQNHAVALCSNGAILSTGSNEDR